MRKDATAQIAIVIVSLLFFAGVIIYTQTKESEPQKQEVTIESIEEIFERGVGSPESLKDLPIPPEVIEQLEASGKN